MSAPEGAARRSLLFVGFFQTGAAEFLKALKGVRTKSGWKVLVVDDESMRDISSCLGMYDIMEQGVTLVEPVYLRREPQPAMEAVYYLTPTEASVDALIRDFEGEKEQYAAVHLLFSKRLPDELLARIKNSAVKKKIRLLRELYLDYLAVEQRVFHLDMHQALWNMYSPVAGDEKDLQLRRMADKLVTVFVTMDQDPVIRSGAGSHLSGSLAALVRERLDAFRKLSPTFGNGETKKPRPLLLVLDRGFDMVSPFTHELTYQVAQMLFLLLRNSQPFFLGNVSRFAAD